MSERDELADIINKGTYQDGDPSIDWEFLLRIADDILAAGYRKPRTVTTAEELDDAIRRSFEDGEHLVLMDRGMRPWIVWEDDYGTAHASSAPYEDDPERLTLAHIDLPATVLHVGGER